jgi:hypothetical protein
VDCKFDARLLDSCYRASGQNRDYLSKAGSILRRLLWYNSGADGQGADFAMLTQLPLVERLSVIEAAIHQLRQEWR